MMLRLIALTAIALGLVAPSFGGPAKAKPAPSTRTVVLDVTGMH